MPSSPSLLPDTPNDSDRRRRNALLSTYYDLPTSAPSPGLSVDGSGRLDTSFSMTPRTPTLSFVGEDDDGRGWSRPGSWAGGAVDAGLTFEAPDPNGSSSQSNARAFSQRMIATSSLSELLQMSIHLRREAQAVEVGLNRAVQDSFANFSAATQVVREVRNAARDILSDKPGIFTQVDSVSNHIDSLNKRLANGRDKVEELEGSKRVLMLLEVAHIMPKWTHELPPKEAARRVNLVLPLLTALEIIHPAFREAKANIDHEVWRLLRERSDQWDAENLQIRILLGERSEELRLGLQNRAASAIRDAMETPLPDSHLSGVIASQHLLHSAFQNLHPVLDEFIHVHCAVFPDHRVEVVDWLLAKLDETVLTPCRDMVRTLCVEIDVAVIAEFIETVKEFNIRSELKLRNCGGAPLIHSKADETLKILVNGLFSEVHAAVLGNQDSSVLAMVTSLWVLAESDVMDEQLMTGIRDFRGKLSSLVRQSRASASTLEAAMDYDVRGANATIEECIRAAGSSLLRSFRTRDWHRESSCAVLVSAKICEALADDILFQPCDPDAVLTMLRDVYVDRIAREVLEILVPQILQSNQIQDCRFERVLIVWSRLKREILAVSQHQARSESKMSKKGRGLGNLDDEYQQLFGDSSEITKVKPDAVFRSVFDLIAKSLIESIRMMPHLELGFVEQLESGMNEMVLQVNQHLAEFKVASNWPARSLQTLIDAAMDRVREHSM